MCNVLSTLPASFPALCHLSGLGAKRNIIPRSPQLHGLSALARLENSGNRPDKRAMEARPEDDDNDRWRWSTTAGYVVILRLWR